MEKLNVQKPVLRPCPFCNGNVDWCEDRLDSGVDHGHACHLVYCPQCKFHFDLDNDAARQAPDMLALYDAVAAAWNNRPSLATERCDHVD